MASIDESSTDDDSDDEYLCTNDIEDIRDGKYVFPDFNTRYSRLKISDHIRQEKSEWRGEELSAKSMGKGLHKVFGDIVI